jgi:transposase
VTHTNAPLTVEGRRRLVDRCRTRPIAHVAAEMGISRATASKWVNRYRHYGELGLLDRASTPHHQPAVTDPAVVTRIEDMRRTYKWPASRIAYELQAADVTVSRRTVTRHLAALGLNHRRFIDPDGDSNREPRKIIARRPGHMIHIDVKKVGRIPQGGGWRPHGRGSDQAKVAARSKRRTKRGGYVCLHSAIDGHSRLAYQRITPYTPRHNGKVERYNRIISEKFLYARTWLSEDQRREALGIWNIHYNYHRPHSAADGQPPAARLRQGVSNVLASYN